MRLSDVDEATVVRVVERLSRRFSTKDVSEAAEMLLEHGAAATERNYHAVIGRWLAVNADWLGIEKDEAITSRGQSWRKVGSSSAPVPLHVRWSLDPVALEPLTEDGSIQPGEHRGTGPQHSGDPPFRARMRLHQSWWRSAVLEADYGTGPTPGSGTHYGNMLTHADALRGLNFLTPEIHEIALARIEAGHGVEPFRCLRNLLSSQPMCFNLFGPLVRDDDLSAGFIRELGLGASVTASAQIEWEPEPRESYLDDRTAFDAMVEWTNGDGSRGLLAIETKLTEPFSPRVTRPEHYVAAASRLPHLFMKKKATGVVDPRWWQLARIQLLAELVAQRRQRETIAWVAVAGHQLDTELWEVISEYRGLLVDRGPRLIELPLDRVLALMRAVVGSEDDVRLAWLDAFERRYVDLSGSAGCT